jgi:hypothetical protein
MADIENKDNQDMLPTASNGACEAAKADERCSVVYDETVEDFKCNSKSENEHVSVRYLERLVGQEVGREKNKRGFHFFALASSPNSSPHFLHIPPVAICCNAHYRANDG